jgi:hypothetical protein
VEVAVDELLPQLSIIAAATKRRTGEITSHRSHRDIVMTLPMPMRGVKAGGRRRRMKAQIALITQI